MSTGLKFRAHFRYLASDRWRRAIEMGGSMKWTICALLVLLTAIHVHAFAENSISDAPAPSAATTAATALSSSNIPRDAPIQNREIIRLTLDEHFKIFSSTFFKNSQIVSLEETRNFTIDEETLAKTPVVAKINELRISSNKKYGIGFKRSGLAYTKKSSGIKISKIEPDSAVDLYLIRNNEFYWIAVLAQYGSAGNVCDSYWHSRDMAVVLSITDDGTGHILVFDLANRKEMRLEINAKYYKGYPLDSEVFSKYYKRVFEKEYKNLFNQFNDD